MFFKSVFSKLVGIRAFFSALFPTVYVLFAAVGLAVISAGKKREKTYGSKPVNVCKQGKNRIKAGVIAEIPLRRTEIIKMQDYFEGEIFGEKYLQSCIALLRSKNLSAIDAEKFALCEKNLSFPVRAEGKEERKNLCGYCGGLITLLAKYK